MSRLSLETRLYNSSPSLFLLSNIYRKSIKLTRKKLFYKPLEGDLYGYPVRYPNLWRRPQNQCAFPLCRTQLTSTDICPVPAPIFPPFTRYKGANPLLK